MKRTLKALLITLIVTLLEVLFIGISIYNMHHDNYIIFILTCFIWVYCIPTLGDDILKRVR